MLRYVIIYQFIKYHDKNKQLGNFGLAWFMVFNATFNNISVLLVEET
jgi:hypothetical protein